jgi:hypothetical protein
VVRGFRLRHDRVQVGFRPTSVAGALDTPLERDGRRSDYGARLSPGRLRKVPSLSPPVNPLEANLAVAGGGPASGGAGGYASATTPASHIGAGDHGVGGGSARGWRV